MHTWVSLPSSSVSPAHLDRTFREVPCEQSWRVPHTPPMFCPVRDKGLRREVEGGAGERPPIPARGWFPEPRGPGALPGPTWERSSPLGQGPRSPAGQASLEGLVGYIRGVEVVNLSSSGLLREFQCFILDALPTVFPRRFHTWLSFLIIFK